MVITLPTFKMGKARQGQKGERFPLEIRVTEEGEKWRRENDGRAKEAIAGRSGEAALGIISWYDKAKRGGHAEGGRGC